MTDKVIPVDPLTALVTNATVSAADTLAHLWKPAQIRRALGYTGPVLPVLAEAVGLGGTGQVLLAVMLRLAERALEDPDENSERRNCAPSC
ncbi:MAG: hypothetical protein QOG20_519 [Pseudonocardiales bacterium]|jgi:hypothetical protein|nr:hypothetical protein [Pseudonocardiales bacterium]